MATPMSAQQVTAELQRKRNFGIPPTSAANQKQYNALKPMAAPAKPATMGAIPQMSSNRSISPVTPMAAQTKPLGGIPNMKPQVSNTGTPAQTTAAVGTTGNGGFFPYSNNINDVRDGADLYSQVLGEDKIARDSLVNATNSQIESLKNSAGYANQLLADQRVLDNLSFSRNNAPSGWDGSTGYREATLARGRQIDDTYRAADLTAAIDSVQQGLTDFDTNAAGRQQSRYDTLLGAERGFGLDVGNQAINQGQLTGTYFNPQAQGIANDIIGLKQQAEAEGITADERNALSSQANALRSQLTNMGYDSSQFGADVNSSVAQGNVSGLGQKTLGQQAQDINSTQTMAVLTGALPNGQKTTAEQQRQLENEWFASDQTGVITDTLASLYNIPKGTPTRAAKEWAREIALTERSTDANIAQGWAQTAISQQNANTSATNATNSQGNAAFGRLLDIWQATGFAPAGIDGVPEGTPYAERSSSSSSGQSDYTTDPSFAQDISWINQNPNDALAEIQSNSEALIAQYGYKGYQELLKAAEG